MGSRDKGRMDLIAQMKKQLPDKPVKDFDEMIAHELGLSASRAKALRLAFEQTKRG